MKKYTIKSSDSKKELESKINSFLELGCELLEGSYEEIEEYCEVDYSLTSVPLQFPFTLYSQVVLIDTNKFNVRFHWNGVIESLGSLNKDGEEEGFYTSWYRNEQKKSEGTWKDGKFIGLMTRWYENGEKEREGNLKGKNELGYPKEDGLWIYWYENGQKNFEETWKDGKQVGKWTSYNEDGSIKEVKEY